MTIRLRHSDRASKLEMACAGRVTVNITSGENLLLIFLSIVIVSLPAISYFSLLFCPPSLNFSMLISLRLAPNNFELMLLSLIYVFRCLDIRYILQLLYSVNIYEF